MTVFKLLYDTSVNLPVNRVLVSKQFSFRNDIMSHINRNIQTLEEFRKQELRHLPNSTGELSNLLRDIALAAKRVNVE
jgi:hypothetical protein